MFMPGWRPGESPGEVVTVFTTSFAKNFGLGLATTGINLAKEEAAEETSDQQLMGFLSPTGSSRRAASRRQGAAADRLGERYFVAYNKADKFVIKYLRGQARRRPTT